MRNQILFLLFCWTGAIIAQPNYAASNIPPQLLLNANVVVRQYDLTFEVLNKGEAIETEHKVLTLLNENASDENEPYFFHDQILKIEDIEGAVYDSAGKMVHKIKKKDIVDSKAFEYYVNDTKRKTIKFPRLPYPYTIEYTVITKYNGLMFYPDFFPQSSPLESVESANLEIIMPQGLEVRVHEINVAKSSKTGNLRWAFRQLSAFEFESYTPKAAFPFARVLCAPTQFSLEGFDGNMSSWESYGKFIEKLNEGKDDLPNATKIKLQQLTADCPDTRCKVERVYEYLQQNTRYFYVGLGIGGWQPMSASDVEAFKYSDCKGLSNYTVAMLRAVQVPAYYALINAGKNNQFHQDPNFPNAGFNHAIACVPLSNDTIWLECTSQTNSCGFLSDFTDNRPALLITPQGGQLVRTPKYNEKTNFIRRNTQLTLSVDGSALLRSEDFFHGIPHNDQATLAEMPEEDRKKILYNALNLNDFEIKSLHIKLKKGRLPEANRTIELMVPTFAAASGKRLFVPIVALAQKMMPPPEDSIRQNPIQATSRGFTTEDQLAINIPQGYSIENGMESFSFSSPFGQYECSIKMEAGQLVIYRKLVLNNSIQPKEQWEVFATFIRNIAKADKTKVVLLKGT